MLHARVGVVLRTHHTEYAFSLIQVNVLHTQQKKSLLDISQMMLGYLLHGLYVYIGLSLNFFFFWRIGLSLNLLL